MLSSEKNCYLFAKNRESAISMKNSHSFTTSIILYGTYVISVMASQFFDSAIPKLNLISHLGIKKRTNSQKSAVNLISYKDEWIEFVKMIFI